jgi:hypothetical protein
MVSLINTWLPDSLYKNKQLKIKDIINKDNISILIVFDFITIDCTINA